ncbi:MFS transporter (macronuclear) [Tetrahymena thermophila SB210]|uniref:MFS transporter n=1 Tax=Tetrahymena thermophila (strain SB210) TaxID=312017 RepID=Q22WI8_TETTS|nr:MFS transporter [Tetrahymena thermophila SB210]EAR89429.2 MFS transporter [Tetrahymena thermophila SB210]|eukprot:XP_001009674.2 MFS transporter [Tetrahymena thermophila SB210]
MIKENSQKSSKQMKSHQIEQLQTQSAFDDDQENESRVFEQQKKNVRYLAFCYLALFVAFNSTQNLVSTLFKQQGFQYLGLISLFFIYFFFAISSLFAKTLIGKYSYKHIFPLSSLGYTSFVLSGIWVCSCSNDNQNEGSCSPFMIYFIVILCSSLCGICSGTLWVGQGGYMECVFALIKHNKGTISGVFWSIRQSSHLIGNVSAMIILNTIDNNIYFFIYMGIIALTASGMFYFIATIEKPKRSHHEIKQQLLQESTQIIRQELPLKEQVSRVLRLMKSLKFQPFLFLNLLSGVAQAFSSGFLRNLVKESVEGDERIVSQSLSFVLITFGIFEYLGGVISGYLINRINVYYLATISTLAILLGLLLSFIGLLTKIYAICFLISSIFGFIDCYINNISQVICNNDYKGFIEVFQAQRLVFAISNTCTQVILLLLTDSPEYTFLSIVFIIALVSNFIVSLFPILGQKDHGLSKHSF